MPPRSQRCRLLTGQDIRPGQTVTLQQVRSLGSRNRPLIVEGRRHHAGQLDQPLQHAVRQPVHPVANVDNVDMRARK